MSLVTVCFAAEWVRIGGEMLLGMSLETLVVEPSQSR
jgi:hypothetical protein